MRGLFLTFEGCEGSGKSTHAKRIYQELIKLGYAVILTHEPGGTNISTKIRGILLSRDEEENVKSKLLPNAELMLYLASRAQHMDELIIPALKTGKIVICDRFSDATMAYQGYARGIDKTILENMNSFVTHQIIPDHTILLDIEAETGLERSKSIKKTFASAGELDRIESESLIFHQKVRQGYLDIASNNAERFTVISATDDKETNFKIIFEQITRLIEKNDISGNNRTSKSKKNP